MSWLMPIHGFERCHADHRVVGGIVPELRQWDLEAPAFRASMGETTKMRLQELIDALCIAISLRMVGRTHVQFSVGVFEQLLP